MKDVRKIADKISFRLLATNKHPDYDWLVGYIIKELIPYINIKLNLRT